MHHIIVAFYAFVFSFGHAAPVHHPEALQQQSPRLTSAYAPTRQEVAHNRYAGSYSETVCVSCRRMNVSYRSH